MTRHSKLLFLGLTIVLMAGLLTFPAFAMEFKEQANNVSKQLRFVPRFTALIAYVIGSFFAARALFALKGFIQDPDDNPLTRVIGFSVVSSMLILLPYAVQVTTRTVVSGRMPEITSGADHFDPTVASSCSGDNSVGIIFCQLALQFQPFASFLALIAYVIAVVLVLMGFTSLKEYGDDPTSVPIRSIIMKFVLASLLISLPLAMQIFITTVTGESSADESVTLKKPQPYKGSIRD